ncbi:hypothetical protein CsSME_00007959 [Camellia sinensis var. sinensis]
MGSQVGNFHGQILSLVDEWQRGLKALTVDTIQNDYKVINMDQWTSFLRFCSQVDLHIELFR